MKSFRNELRRNEIGFGGYDAWTEQVFAEDARNASRLDAKLKIEAHWLERGVTARRKRNQGRLAKLWEMRAARAAMDVATRDFERQRQLFAQGYISQAALDLGATPLRAFWLAAVPFEIHQHRSAGTTTTPPAPSRNSQHQAGQQHIIDAAVEGRRHPGEQCSRRRRRQRERETPSRAVDVALGIERAAIGLANQPANCEHDHVARSRRFVAGEHVDQASLRLPGVQHTVLMLHGWYQCDTCDRVPNLSGEFRERVV